MSCECCGNFIPTVGKNRGRPKLYCSDQCRDFVKFINALEKSLDQITFTIDASRVVRGDLFSLANNVYHNHTMVNNGRKDYEKEFTNESR